MEGTQDRIQLAHADIPTDAQLYTKGEDLRVLAWARPVRKAKWAVVGWSSLSCRVKLRQPNQRAPEDLWQRIGPKH